MSKKKKVVVKKVSVKSKKIAARVEKIFTLRNKGMSVEKISAKVGLSVSGVSYHLNK